MNNGLKRHSLVIAAYIVLTLCMTIPLAWQFTDHIAGSGGDPWQTLWRFEDKAQALNTAIHNGQLWPLVHHEFLGGGEAQLVNLTVWPWMPLHYLFGQPLTYNLVWWLSFILSGYGMYLLVRVLLPEDGWRAEAAAFLAGVLYMFMPFHVAHAMGHFGAMQIQWLPLSLWAFLKWINKPSFWKAFLFSLFIFIQALSEHHYLVWLAIAGMIYIIFSWASFKTALKRSPVSLMIISLAGVLIILAYFPTIRLAGQSNSSLVLGQGQTIRFSADLLSFITPAPFHTLWGSMSNYFVDRFFTGNVTEATHFLGFVPLLLILFFHQRIPHQIKRVWTILALVFLVISLGPWMHVLGRVLPIPLPYALIDSWPVFSSIRAVARASVVVALSWAVLFGWVLYTQLNRRKSAVLIGVAVIIEFLFMPVVSQSFALPRAYAELKNIPGSTIIEIPAATNYVAASKALYAEHIHGKHVLANSALERALEQDAYEDIKQIPGIKQVLFVRTTDFSEGRTEFFGQDSAEVLPDALQWLDVAAILIHPDSLTSRQLALMQSFLEQRVGLQAEHIDDVVLYKAQPISKSDGVFVVRGNGWDQVIYDKEKQVTIAAFSRKAEVRIINVTDHDLSAHFEWDIAKDSRGHMQGEYNGNVILEQDATDTQHKTITLSVRPGESVLQFTNTLPGTFILQDPEFHSTVY